MALYACENFFETYWFISEVLPTLFCFVLFRREKKVMAMSWVILRKEKKTIDAFCLFSSSSKPYPESPRMMTLRRVLRLPAEAIVCAGEGERRREEREREERER